MISKRNAEHYSWGEGCDGWHLVKSPDLSVIQEQMPPRTSETRHSHARSRQFFFILSGTLTIEVEGECHLLGPQEGLEVPPEQAHQVLNESDASAEFVVVSQPPSHGDRKSEEAGRRHHV